MSSSNLVKEKVFLNKSKYDDAERAHYCNLPVNLKSNTSDTKVEIADEFSKVRQQLRDQLGNVDPTLNLNDIIKRLSSLEAENKDLKSKLNAIEARVVKLEKSGAPQAAQPAKEESNKQTDKKTKSTPAPAPVQTQPAAKKNDEVNDDDFELFGDDDEEESEEKKRITEERLAAYASKKEKKPALVAKSSVILDVKPWDDETDMKKLEESVRSVEMDGLLWGTSKFVPIAYGVKKLQITCVIEDDKVSTEELDERICEFEDYVQSVDIVSFNKI